MPVWLTTIFSILSPIVSVLTFYLKVKSTREKDEAERKKARAAENEALKSSITSGLKEVNETIDRIQKETTKQMTEIASRHDKDIAALRLEFEKQYQLIFERVDERRRKDTKDLHNRIDEFQGGFASDVVERIGKLEGSLTAELKNCTNFMELIQRSLLEKNGGI